MEKGERRIGSILRWMRSPGIHLPLLLPDGRPFPFFFHRRPKIDALPLFRSISRGLFYYYATAQIFCPRAGLPSVLLLKCPSEMAEPRARVRAIRSRWPIKCMAARSREKFAVFFLGVVLDTGRRRIGRSSRRPASCCTCRRPRKPHLYPMR